MRKQIVAAFVVGSMGCSGISERTVEERADTAQSGGDSESGGVSGSASSGSTFGGASGTATAGNAGSFPIQAGSGGASTGGASCLPLPGDPVLHLLSSWEYERNVLAITGNTVTGPLPSAPETMPGFSFELSVEPDGVRALFDEAERQAKLPSNLALSSCDPGSGLDATCAVRLVDGVVGRAFRRPLRDFERSRYVDLFKLGSGNGDFATGANLVLEAALLSPFFLFKLYLGDTNRVVGQASRLTSSELAARLSLLTTGSPPDSELWAAGSGDTLNDDATLAKEARRLVQTPAFVDAAQHFIAQELEIDESVAATPDLTPPLLESMHTSAQLFIADVLRKKHDLFELLTSDSAFVDPLLAPRYGVPAPSSGFLKVTLAPNQYSGVLTLPSTLTRFANPSRRGNLVKRRLLCQPVPPHPPGIDTNIQVAPGETRRQAWERQKTSATCNSCHQSIDPIGFGFENFDELGVFRVTDNGSPVDASGMLTDGANGAAPFVGPTELGRLLAGNNTVIDCFARTWFSYALERSLAPTDECDARSIVSAFQAHGLDLRELVVAIAQSAAFRHTGIPLPFGGAGRPVVGALVPDAARQKALLDFALDEAMSAMPSLSPPQQLAINRYVEGLRQLEQQLGSLSNPVPPPPTP